MWTHEASIETNASAERVWSFFSDVPGWKHWNDGIEEIAIHGPFEAGTTFTMRIPGDMQFTSRLLAVTENALFTDETIIGETRVVVHHRIIPLSAGRSRILYSTEISGPAAAELGPMVTADFQAVLSSLKRMLEVDERISGRRDTLDAVGVDD